jgi:hypothetical protein
MRHSRWQIVLLVLVCTLTPLSGCMDSGDTYAAQIVRIEPPVPGLVVKGGDLQGGLYIRNDTGVDIYFYDDQGREQVKLASEALFHKGEQGEWVYDGKGNEMSWGGDTIYEGSRGNQPAGRYRGQVMKEWVIAGRAGDTPFKIYGQTIYAPR